MGESTNPTVQRRRPLNEFVQVGTRWVDVHEASPEMLEYLRVKVEVDKMTPGLHRELLVSTLQTIHEDIKNEGTAEREARL